MLNLLIFDIQLFDLSIENFHSSFTSFSMFDFKVFLSKMSVVCRLLFVGHDAKIWLHNKICRLGFMLCFSYEHYIVDYEMIWQSEASKRAD